MGQQNVIDCRIEVELFVLFLKDDRLTDGETLTDTSWQDTPMN